mmetsp:Transcript_148791/g.259497  ORF Transcript_148791/g.259497 Transcript_148791/m.259497 type:complete len:243 (+) Transcript_148791:999-1727(+)
MVHEGWCVKLSSNNCQKCSKCLMRLWSCLCQELTCNLQHHLAGKHLPDKQSTHKADVSNHAHLVVKLYFCPLLGAQGCKVRRRRHIVLKRSLTNIQQDPLEAHIGIIGDRILCKMRIQLCTQIRVHVDEVVLRGRFLKYFLDKLLEMLGSSDPARDHLLVQLCKLLNGELIQNGFHCTDDLLIRPGIWAVSLPTPSCPPFCSPGIFGNLELQILRLCWNLGTLLHLMRLLCGQLCPSSEQAR